MKRRPKNKKVLIVFISVCIVLAVVPSVFIYYKIGLETVSSRETPTSFQVQPGGTSEAVLDESQTQELACNKAVAKLYMKFHELSDVKADNFKLGARWDTPKILETLNDSKQANADGIKITFKEDIWAKDAVALIEEQTDAKAGELLALWNDDAYLNTLIRKHSSLSRDILNAQYKVKLKGCLYPEAYSFHKDVTVEQITETFLDQFQKAIASYEADIKKSGMNMREAITFASIAQYEASMKEDTEMIVGTFQNRLKQGTTLDSSVTVCYALYDDTTSGEDCEVNTHIDSSHNIYKDAGLSIEPILNPGAMAIQAVLHPRANDYLYLVADIYGDGKVYYVRTLDEQEVNVDEHNLRKWVETMKKTILIDIAGGGASGKTSISVQLKEYYEDTNSVVVIRQDDYYKNQSGKTVKECVETNYDHPFAFDNELLAAQLQRLLQRRPICKPTYDFARHTRSEVIEEIEPSDAVVIEGPSVLENEDLRNLRDIKIPVDTDADTRFIRRLLRDVNERGRMLESVVEQYTSTVRDTYNLPIESSRHYVDIIIPEGDHNVIAIDLLITKISSIISEDVV